MTHSLTPDEQQQVDAAAKKYANENAWIGDFSEVTRADTIDWEESSFKAGVDFALQHLFASRMEKFAEWCDAIAVRCGQHEWTIGAGSETKRYTTAELVEKYLQYLEPIKQKEDGKEENKN